jgi:hypothetical protein
MDLSISQKQRGHAVENRSTTMLLKRDENRPERGAARTQQVDKRKNEATRTRLDHLAIADPVQTTNRFSAINCYQISEGVKRK